MSPAPTNNTNAKLTSATNKLLHALPQELRPIERPAFFRDVFGFVPAVRSAGNSPNSKPVIAEIPTVKSKTGVLSFI
jgi:hypothetical protein